MDGTETRDRMNRVERPPLARLAHPPGILLLGGAPGASGATGGAFFAPRGGRGPAIREAGDLTWPARAARRYADV